MNIKQTTNNVLWSGLEEILTEQGPFDLNDVDDNLAMQKFVAGLVDALIAAGVISETSTVPNREKVAEWLYMDCLKEGGSWANVPEVIRDNWRRKADDLLGVISEAKETGGGEFRVIDTTRPTWKSRNNEPFVDITDLPNLEAAQRYIRGLAEDGFAIDGLVIESRSGWRPAVALAAQTDSDNQFDKGLDAAAFIAEERMSYEVHETSEWEVAREIAESIRAQIGSAVALAVPETKDEKTLLDPPWLCVGGDNCGDRFATLGDAHAPHSAAYHPIVRCAECGTPIHFYESPTGSWWSHVVHPSDEHDAEPGIDREKAFRIMNAILDENEHPARPQAGAN